MKRIYNTPQSIIESFEITANILDVSPTTQTMSIQSSRGMRQTGNSGRAESRERDSFDEGEDEDWGSMW